VSNKSMEQLVGEIHGSVEYMRGKIETHIENESIHQNPPCRFHRQLSNRLWGLLIVGLTGIGGNVWLWIHR